MRRVVVGVSVGVIALVAVARAQDDASKEDLKKLQGKWELVKIIADGKEEKAEGGPWTIKDNKLVYGIGTYDVLTLDATKKPRTIDIKAFREEGGKEMVYDLKAIYKIEDDTVTICVDPKGKQFPEAFESKAGSGLRLFTLRRSKAQ